MDLQGKKIIVTGGGGFLGSAVVRVLRGRGCREEDVFVVRSKDYDLRDARAACEMYGLAFGGAGRADVVLHCAGRIGGLLANTTHPGAMFYENMVIGANVVEGARGDGLAQRGGKVVVVGSMTSYPADAPMPLREESLWEGKPHGASAAYAIAKLGLLAMQESYREEYGLSGAYVIPVNLYGPGDNIDDVRNAHVAGSLVKRFVDAVESGAERVVCWGTGSPTREFLYVEDCAEGVVRAAEALDEPVPVNLGAGVGGSGEVSIRELAETIAELAGFAGEIEWDASKPDGQARRCMDSSRAKELMGWEAGVGLRDGLARTVEWYTRRRGGV